MTLPPDLALFLRTYNAPPAKVAPQSRPVYIVLTPSKDDKEPPF